MRVLRRLYRYLARYKGWATLAFGSMVVFALSQTVLIALTQPIFDVVLAPPAQRKVEPTHVSREQATRERVLNTMLLGGRVAAFSYRRGWHGRLRVSRHEIDLGQPGLLPAPLVIGFASDFHAGPTTHPGVFDALHLACLEAARVDVMLTTDDSFVRKASRGDGRPRVAVRNPLSWSQENPP